MLNLAIFDPFIFIFNSIIGNVLMCDSSSGHLLAIWAGGAFQNQVSFCVARWGGV